MYSESFALAQRYISAAFYFAGGAPKLLPKSLRPKTSVGMSKNHAKQTQQEQLQRAFRDASAAQLWPAKLWQQLPALQTAYTYSVIYSTILLQMFKNNNIICVYITGCVRNQTKSKLAVCLVISSADIALNLAKPPGPSHLPNSYRNLFNCKFILPDQLANQLGNR